jgi:hypothetical protein
MTRRVYPVTSDAERAECYRRGAADWRATCPYEFGEQRWAWQQGAIDAENAFLARQREMTLEGERFS